MEICIKENRTDIIHTVANLVSDKINNAQGTFILGLSTGLTVLDICEELAQKVRNKELSFENVIIFIAGEFVGFNYDNPNTYLSRLKEVFFSQIDIPIKNIYSLNGCKSDLKLECEHYEELIDSFGGMDLFIGSLGSNGNVAFNEPYSSLSSKTRLKTLTMQTLKADARFFNNIADVPTKALTMGMSTIYNAKEVILAVYGINKAFALESCLEKSISDSHPASILQMHPKTSFIIDKVAGRLLIQAFR